MKKQMHTNSSQAKASKPSQSRPAGAGSIPAKAKAAKRQPRTSDQFVRKQARAFLAHLGRTNPELLRNLRLKVLMGMISEELHPQPAGAKAPATTSQKGI